MITTSEIIAALIKVKDKYGLPFAKDLESLFRTETRHWKSEGFLKALCPGMEATTKSPPNYGWSSLNLFWLQNPQYGPTGLFSMKDNDAAISKSRGVRNFLIFPTIEASMMTVAHHISVNKKGNFGGWFNNIPKDQQNYVKIMRGAIPRYCNALK